MNRLSRAATVTIFGISLGTACTSPEQDRTETSVQVVESGQSGIDMTRVMACGLLIISGAALRKDYSRICENRRQAEDYEIGTFKIRQDANHIEIMSEYEFDNEMEIVLRSFKKDNGSA